MYLANFSMPITVQYDYDGYGVLARTLRDNIVFNNNSSDIMGIGFPQEFGNFKITRKIGLLTMFESDEIPPSWSKKINENYNFIIVPSTFCRDIFYKCGVKVPIYVVPLFASDFTIYEPNGIFTFGHQNSFIYGSQKGWDLVIRAFIELNLPSSRLILKARKSHLRACNKEYIEYARKQKNIEVVIEDYDDKQMHTDFYSKLNCFVYPSRGEGFGLPPLEAMAHSIPTILTKAHSMADFSSYGIEIGTIGKVESYYVERVNEDVSGKWVEPDFNELKEKMKDVYKKYVQHKKRAKINARVIQRLYNKNRFLLNFIETAERGFCFAHTKQRKKVYFINDWRLQDTLGGAQMSMDYLMMKSPIDVCEIRTDEIKEFPKDGLIIFNSLIRFSEKQLKEIAGLKNYIIFDHNYSFCRHQDSRHTNVNNKPCNCPNKKLFQTIYNNARLMIFMSPLHEKEFRKEFTFHKTWLCPAVVDTERIPMGKEKDIRNMTILYPMNHKGVNNVRAWARENGEDVVFIDNGENDAVLSLMRRSKNFIFMPNWIEPFGRVVVEACLSGCKIIGNENIGALSWGWDFTNADEIRDKMETYPYLFWEKVLENT